MSTTTDCKGAIVAAGDMIRILDISPDPDMDDDDRDMFLDMIGATCAVESIDRDGAAWVAIWWNGGESTLTTQVGLFPSQMEKVAA